MRVLHCCLACFYIDNYGYQENVLPKMHMIQGHEVKIIASTETFIDNLKLGYVKPKSYFTSDQIPIVRLPYVNWLPFFIAKKLRIYFGLYEEVNNFQPDIIFLHDCQFLGIFEIIRYVKKFPHVKIFVDGHTDEINSARNFFSKYILHKIIYRYCAKSVEPYTKKFYGVLPARVKFFEEFYGIKRQKLELLELGYDDTEVDFSNQSQIRKHIRDSIGICDNSFVIITGGKITAEKNIKNLVKAFVDLEYDNATLIIFGSIEQSVLSELELEIGKTNIQFVGWLSPKKILNYFLASDLGFFAGLHTVLWETAVGTGLPCVFPLIPGYEHVDLGGNCVFINSTEAAEIKRILEYIMTNEDVLDSMRTIAQDVGRKYFSYYDIAKRAITG